MPPTPEHLRRISKLAQDLLGASQAAQNHVGEGRVFALAQVVAVAQLIDCEVEGLRASEREAKRLRTQGAASSS